MKQNMNVYQLQHQVCLEWFFMDSIGKILFSLAKGLGQTLKTLSTVHLSSVQHCCF